MQGMSTFKLSNKQRETTRTNFSKT